MKWNVHKYDSRWKEQNKDYTIWNSYTIKQNNYFKNSKRNKQDRVEVSIWNKVIFQQISEHLKFPDNSL